VQAAAALAKAKAEAERTITQLRVEIDELQALSTQKVSCSQPQLHGSYLFSCRP
jgi:hypothetical protein